MRTNINNIVTELPIYFIFDDVKALMPNSPDASIRRVISTMTSRRQIVNLRRANGTVKAIYAKK